MIDRAGIIILLNIISFALGFFYWEYIQLFLWNFRRTWKKWTKKFTPPLKWRETNNLKEIFEKFTISRETKDFYSVINLYFEKELLIDFLDEFCEQDKKDKIIYYIDNFINDFTDIRNRRFIT